MTATLDETPAAPSAGPPKRRRRKGRTALIASGAVGLVIALFVGVLATREPAASRTAPSRLIGRPAPDVSGPTIDNDRFTLVAQQGKYVLVNFFATWCVPCVEEHADLKAFHERHSASGDAMVVSVVYRDDPRDVRAFFAEHGGNWPIVEDEAAKVDWGVRGVPESFLVGPDGVVVTRIVGGVTESSLENILSEVRKARRDPQ